MERNEILRRVGSLEQLAFIRPVEFWEGRADGLRAFDVQNGPLRLQVLADKALDIGQLSFKGVNFTFLSKPGLQGRNAYDTRGLEAQRSIMGGLFFTAGLENICAPCVVDGKEFPMHGRIRSTPAVHLSSDARWEGEDYVLRLSGEAREAELFGENMVLRRSIETRFGEPSVTITDEIENQSFRPEPLLLLYHINIGYPLLDGGTELLLPTRSVTARDEDGAGHVDRWNVMDAPVDNEPEYVFIHEPVPAPDGTVSAAVLNEKLGLGLKLTYSAETLPRFMEWKSVASGDYVLGLEPANAGVSGRPGHGETGRTLEPFEKECTRLTFTVLDGRDALRKTREEIKSFC